MSHAEAGRGPAAGGPFAPLKEPTFRTIWSASLLSNSGQLILGVGAAWEMTRLTPDASMVALVQTAMMVPLMLVAVPAGAIADMFDRRRIALTGLSFATISAAVLTALALMGLTTPWILLAFCSLIGAGVAFYAPAWQASIVEQVEPAHLPAAVALGSVSYNVARTFGPAVGGAIVMAFGAMAAFAANALCYLPLLIAFFFWKRRHVPSRLPPERFDRAIIAGGRYVLHAPAIRIVLIRAFSFGVAVASTAALPPLIARDLLNGDARTYGLLLASTGVGAVVGALSVSRVRHQFKAEHAVALCAVVGGLAVFSIGFSHHLWLTMPLMMIGGSTYTLLIALLSVAVQLSAPRWVSARAIAWFSSSITGGIAFGAWLWGHVTAQWGVDVALMASGCLLFLNTLYARVLPMPPVSLEEAEQVGIASEPEVGLSLTARSGPIAIEIDYEVEPAQARAFYDAMLRLQHARIRNGGFDWSIARDIGDPRLWTERFHCPTWGDYLRLRSRFTHSDHALQAAADAFHSGAGPRVRRRLERPLGSVRWQPDTPDPQSDAREVYPT